MLGAVSHRIDADRGDELTSAYAETGLRLGSESRAITPFAAMSYGRLERGGFTETGANDWGLTARRQTYTQAAGAFGMRLDTAWNWAGGRSQLSAYAAWQGIICGADTPVRAAFVGAPDATFNVEGVQTPRHAAWLGVGVTTQARHGWSWFVNADGQVSGGPTKSLNLTAGVRRRF